jgi:hypothetical protein
MRIQSALAIVAFVTAAALAAPAPGSAQTDTQSAARIKRQAAGAGLQIACTRTGCHPIPRGCTIEKEFGWDGLPTGYDLVVCPPR